MPTANRRDFIPRAVASFLRQDYPDKELIVVDDGSDPIFDILPTDDRIKYIRLAARNSVGTKRNLGCQAARGEIIAHFDDDDWSAPGRLTYQAAELEREHAQVVGLQTLLFYDTIHRRAYEYRYTQPRFWLSGSSLCYRKSFWASHPFPDRDVGEDAHFVWSGRGEKMLALAEHTFHVGVIHGKNVSPKLTNQKSWTVIDVEIIKAIVGDDFSNLQGPGAALPLVSCVMLTHDRRRIIPLAIESYQAQDYPATELIVVDDGADAVGDMIESIPGAQYVRLNRRTSIGDKRNLAVDAARGEIIATFDDDDWSAAGRITYQTNPILQDRADMTGMNNAYVYELLTGACWEITPALHQRMFYGNLHGGTLVFKKDLFKMGIRYPALNLAEDAALMRQVVQRHKRLERMPNLGMYVYMRHPGITWRITPGKTMNPAGWKRVEPPDEFTPELRKTWRGILTSPEQTQKSTRVIDCLGRVSMLKTPRPHCKHAIVTIASRGFAEQLDDCLGSIAANGQCPDAQRVVIVVDGDPECERVAEKHRAWVVAATSDAKLDLKVKAALYSIAGVIDADAYVCMDADTLVLADLRPIFTALAALPVESILAASEGNDHRLPTLHQGLIEIYGATEAEADRLLKDQRERNYPLIVNDGVFAGGRDALLALDTLIRKMTDEQKWMESRADVWWRNQAVFNIALARLRCGVELDSLYNWQLHVRDYRAGAKILHFNGRGRKKNAELRGKYAAILDPLNGTGEDDYLTFTDALRRFVGARGVTSLAWSFYGTTDGKNARLTDVVTFPLLAALHYLIRSNGVVRVIETGTARGVSAACLASAVNSRENARVVTLDNTTHPDRDALWGSLPASMIELIEPRLIDAIGGLRAALGAGEKYEAALLDSVHSESHVWSEFELARQLVCPGGLILIHDARWARGTVDKALKRIERAGYNVVRLWCASAGVAEDDQLGLAIVENRRRTP